MVDVQFVCSVRILHARYESNLETESNCNYGKLAFKSFL